MSRVTVERRRANRPLVIERKSQGFRRTPEAILIGDEEARDRIDAARAERIIPEEVALRTALDRFAAVVGWPEARGWLAARAHEVMRGGSKRSGMSRARAEAEAIFGEGQG